MGYKWFRVSDSGPIEIEDAPPRIEGATTPTLTINGALVSEAGLYYAEVFYTDIQGNPGVFSSQARLRVEGPPVIADITPDQELEEGEELMLTVSVVNQSPAASPTYTFEWYLDGFKLNETSNTYFVDGVEMEDAGTYTVKIISDNGCGEIEATIKVNVKSSVYETSNPNFRIVSVMPNPVTHEASANFILPDAQDFTLSLVDLTGRFVAELYSGFGTIGMNVIRFDDKLLNISSGTYFVILESQGRKTSYQISINK
jgi:hypothetical protein